MCAETTIVRSRMVAKFFAPTDMVPSCLAKRTTISRLAPVFPCCGSLVLFVAVFRFVFNCGDREEPDQREDICMLAIESGRRFAIARGISIVLAFCIVHAAAQADEPAIPDDQLETPAQIWQRCQETLLPFNFEIQKDEIVPSDTRPEMKLRRVEVKFYSQELDGKKWGHPCVVYMPADKSITVRPTGLASV